MKTLKVQNYREMSLAGALIIHEAVMEKLSRGEPFNLGLATDVAGGATTSMFAAIRSAIQVSKLRYRLFDTDTEALTFPEAFFLATKGGGAFFGNAGSFEKGCPFDALILDDMAVPTVRDDLTVVERAERFIYLGDERYITGKYAGGVRII